MTHQDLEQRYKKNMLFIGKLDRNLFEKINNADISHLGIDITDKGINVSSHGQYLYPKDVDDAIDQQVETFLKQKTSIFKKPCYHQNGPGAPLHCELQNKIMNIIPANKNYTYGSYDTNPHINTLPLLVINAIGSGKHIQMLFEKVRIKHLVIVDQDYSFLKLCMHIIDWESGLSTLFHSGGKVEFFIKNDPFENMRNIINTIQMGHLYKSYYLPYYIHYSSPFFTNIKEYVLSKYQLMQEGWGFIDDELNSLNKTRKNLEHNIPVYMGTNKKLPSNATLFIVASGPSIDKDIQYIKKNQDNAVIFSCGTALRVLEKNDIVPDFHFEIEREEEIHDVLQQYTSKKFREKIALIGLNVLYDKVFTEDFKESYLYFRSSDSGASIVPDTIPKLHYTNPTVTNGALSFADQFSWDKIYLFGVDMGFKDISKHHSKDAMQYIEDQDGLEWEKAHPQRKQTKQVQSNLGDTLIGTNDLFFWSKQSLENILVHSTNTVFNCSDGAKIEYTLPYPSKDISIVSHNKQEVIDSIKSNFKDLHTHEPQFKSKYKEQVTQYYQTIDILKQKLTARDIKSFDDIFDTLDDVFEIFTHPVIDKSLPDHPYWKELFTLLLRGTIATAFSIIYTHSMATHNLLKATQFASESFLLLSKFLESLKTSIYFSE